MKQQIMIAKNSSCESDKNRLKTLKRLSFKLLCSKYQTEDNNPIDKFRKLEDKVKHNKPNKFLDEFYSLLSEFSDYYEAFFHNYNKFTKSYRNPSSSTNLIDLKRAKIFAESCIIHINRINNNYIQPLLLDINLEKANKSINIGRWSILVGIIATIISLIFSINSSKQTDVLIDETHNNYIELSKTIKTQNNSLLKHISQIELKNNSLRKMTDTIVIGTKGRYNKQDKK